MLEKLEQLKQVVEDILTEARLQGATAAEAGVSATQGIAATVRLGEVETIEHNSDNGMGITVYFGHRKGSASTTDLSQEAIKQTVEAACNIARYTTDDPYSGLANPEEMLTEQPDLDLVRGGDLGFGNLPGLQYRRVAHLGHDNSFHYSSFVSTGANIR